MSMQLACTPRMDGAAPGGGEPIGIGIPGLTPSLSFRATGFSIARSAGVSIPRGGYIKLRSSGTVMGTADTDADTVTTTITSVQTPVCPASSILSGQRQLDFPMLFDRYQQQSGLWEKWES